MFSIAFTRTVRLAEGLKLLADGRICDQFVRQVGAAHDRDDDP